MIAQDGIAGLDVSKERLDVFVRDVGCGLASPTTEAGLTVLIDRLRRLKVRCIGLEASGGYERRAAHRLGEARFSVFMLDPAQVRAFARAMKTRAKTDPIDAAMIARYIAAAVDRLVPFTPDPHRERLSALTGLRRRLVAEISEHKSLIDTAEDPLVRSTLARRLAALTADRDLVETAIKALIADSRTLKPRFDTLKATPASGPCWPPCCSAICRNWGGSTPSGSPPWSAWRPCPSVRKGRKGRHLLGRTRPGQTRALYGDLKRHQSAHGPSLPVLSPAQNGRETLQDRHPRHHAKVHHDPQRHPPRQRTLQARLIDSCLARPSRSREAPRFPNRDHRHKAGDDDKRVIAERRQKPANPSTAKLSATLTTHLAAPTYKNIWRTNEPYPGMRPCGISATTECGGLVCARKGYGRPQGFAPLLP
jgi:hypothetical protein